MDSIIFDDYITPGFGGLVVSQDGRYVIYSNPGNMSYGGGPPWIDVYDSATWSAIVELSRQSIDKGGSSVEFPDFTNGRWKNV